MKGVFATLTASLLAGVASASPVKRAAEPFLISVGNLTWVIGNDVWNMTQGPKYGVKLNYKDRDCVGTVATGHYVSYSMLSNRLSHYGGT